jgi:hypothetical protein
MGPKGVSEKRLDPHRRGGYSRNENGRRRHENVRFAQRPGLALPAGETVELKPGDYHVMLVDLKIPLRKDTTIPMTLVFQNAKGVQTQTTIQVPVQMTLPQTATAHGALKAGGIRFGLCVGWVGCSDVDPRTNGRSSKNSLQRALWTRLRVARVKQDTDTPSLPCCADARLIRPAAYAALGGVGVANLWGFDAVKFSIFLNFLSVYLLDVEFFCILQKWFKYFLIHKKELIVQK